MVVATAIFNSEVFKDDFKNVYKPADDSFLLLEAVQNDAEFIQNSKPAICFEIGSGSGIQITSLAKMFKGGYFLSTDINPYACQTTLKCARYNQVAGNLEAVNSSMTTCFGDRLKGLVDLLVINPPFCPTENEEVKSDVLLNLSTSGGKDGRLIIDSFLSSCLNLMSKSGLIYMVCIEQNRPEEIVEQIKSRGFDSEIVMKRPTKNTRQLQKGKQTIPKSSVVLNVIRSRRLN